MILYFSIIFFILWSLIWSFFSVLTYRFKNKLPWSFLWRSFCPNCKITLKAKNLIPIFSYLIQRGKCESCKKKIHIKYLLFELIWALSFSLWILFLLSKGSLTFSQLLTCLFTFSFLYLLILYYYLYRQILNSFFLSFILFLIIVLNLQDFLHLSLLHFSIDPQDQSSKLSSLDIWLSNLPTLVLLASIYFREFLWDLRFYISILVSSLFFFSFWSFTSSSISVLVVVFLFALFSGIKERTQKSNDLKLLILLWLLLWSTFQVGVILGLLFLLFSSWLYFFFNSLEIKKISQFYPVGVLVLYFLYFLMSY